MLIDTGSNVTIIKSSLLNLWPLTERPNIMPVNMTLVTATGEISPFLGKINASITLGSQTISHDVLLADINNDGIIGVDFLNANKCDVMLTKKCLNMNGEKIPCFLKDQKSTHSCCRIAVSENITIPPESEMIVPGKIIDDVRGTLGVIEPKQSFVEKSGLLVAKALINVNVGEIPIRVINLSNEPHSLYKNTIAATYEPVALPQIVDVKTVDTSMKNKHDNNEVPSHMKDVYERAIKHLSDKQA